MQVLGGRRRFSALVGATLLLGVVGPVVVAGALSPQEEPDGTAPPPPPSSTTVSPSASSTTTTSVPPPAGAEASAGVLRNADAADPFLVWDQGQPWLFTTNNRAGNVPVATGRRQGGDEVTVADALPTLPAWAREGFTWAPAVTRTADGWVLAFTARARASDRQCVGVATSPTVGGPYTAAAAPLVCHPEEGGSIDPSFVLDGTGDRWLLYKDDGNCCGLPTSLHAVRLTPAATATAGPAATLLSADLAWEGGLVEAPTMRRVGDRWLLLYSANRWDTDAYAVGAAWCASPTGPCDKQDEPALRSTAELAGPGGVELASGLPVEGVVVTFHAWPQGAVGYDDGEKRRLHLGRVRTTGDQVTVVPIWP